MKPKKMRNIAAGINLFLRRRNVNIIKTIAIKKSDWIISAPDRANVKANPSWMPLVTPLGTFSNRLQSRFENERSTHTIPTEKPAPSTVFLVHPFARATEPIAFWGCTGKGSL